MSSSSAGGCSTARSSRSPGTNGKTTAVELLGEIWRAAGREVALAGNVGTPVTALVDDLPAGATVICEASSYQLHDAVAFAPEVGLILNLTPDHLAWHGTLEAYRAAKLRLFEHQGPARRWRSARASCCAGAGGEARRVVVGREPGDDLALRDGALWWQGERLIGLDGDPPARARTTPGTRPGPPPPRSRPGIDPEPVVDALRTFAGVEHRLEDVRTLDGVTWVNDSKSTNIASTTVALDTFNAPIHLILGGQAKDQDFTTLRGAICARVVAVHLIGEDAGRIADDLDGHRPAVRRRRPRGGRPGRPGDRPRRRDRPAVARLRELRPVRRLRGARASVQGARDSALTS